MKFLARFRSKKVPVSEPEALALLRVGIYSDDLSSIKAVISAFPNLLGFADTDGSTPLHWAAKAQKLSSVGCLVDLGADITKTDKRGLPPAAYASDEVHMGALTDLCRLIQERIAAGPLK